jgi:hypothetical protein
MRYTAKEHAQAAQDRLDVQIITTAKRFGHHGSANLIETVKQRHNVQIDLAYAEHLCKEWARP